MSVATFNRALMVVESVLALLACLAIPCLAQAGPNEATRIVVSHERSLELFYATRSWYGGSIQLFATQSTGWNYYDGDSVGIEMTCSSTLDGTFTVELRRKSDENHYESLGKASFNRNGFTKATWEGVGSGTYCFVLEKPTDGVVVNCSDIAMYSW